MISKVWNIKPLNTQQTIAIEALLNPEIDLVILEGVAGSGKSLLALAAGLEQVVESKLYKEIIFTRNTVSIGDDIGFLPGEEVDKLAPWCGAVEDSLDLLLGDSLREEVLIRNKIKLKALQFMRGRSFNRRYIILDECQNISAHDLKILLTRAGPDTKVICLGDSHQIDNKRLSVGNNGLAWLINSACAPYIKYIALPQGERSRLASYLNTLEI